MILPLLISAASAVRTILVTSQDDAGGAVAWLRAIRTRDQFERGLLEHHKTPARGLGLLIPSASYSKSMFSGPTQKRGYWQLAAALFAHDD